ncbi:MAG: FkbM family methyltransferase [Ruminococcus sp.]|jgi:FkbM family methyltransferase|nr:FkbM family methyltransferase [Ruminococcus sp.]
MDVSEKINIWDNIRSLNLPVYIYGMGDGADKIFSIMALQGIEPTGVYASDEFVRGQSFHGFKVLKLREIEEKTPEFVTVLAFGSNRPEVISHIKEVAKKYKLFAPDMAVTDFTSDRLFTYEYFLSRKSEFESVYSLFADEPSRKLFTDIINYKISGKIEYLLSETVEFSDILGELFLTDSEIYADCGAYTGDTISIFCDKVNNKYKYIYGFEPSGKTFARLQKNTAGLENITLNNAAVWSESGEITAFGGDNRNNNLFTTKNNNSMYNGDSSNKMYISSKNNNKYKYSGKTTLTETVRLDEISPDATVIKLDVEGAEKQALAGAEKLIKSGVKLICAVYHRIDDLWEIPLIINKMNHRYRFKLRRLPCLPAWDIFLSAYME